MTENMKTLLEAIELIKGNTTKISKGFNYASTEYEARKTWRAENAKAILTLTRILELDEQS